MVKIMRKSSFKATKHIKSYKISSHAAEIYHLLFDLQTLQISCSGSGSGSGLYTGGLTSWAPAEGRGQA